MADDASFQAERGREIGRAREGGSVGQLDKGHLALEVVRACGRRTARLEDVVRQSSFEYDGNVGPVLAEGCECCSLRQLSTVFNGSSH